MNVKFLEINQEQEWVKFTVDVNGEPYTKKMMVEFKPLVIVHENVKIDEKTGEETIEKTEQVVSTKNHILLQIDRWYKQYIYDLKAIAEAETFDGKSLINKKIDIDINAILDSDE